MVEKDQDQHQMKTAVDETQTIADQQGHANAKKTAQNDGFRYDYDDSSDL
jgi:hypothetical protein